MSALDQASTSDQLKKGLDKVRKHYENWRNTLLEAVGESPIPNKYGNQPEQQAQPTQAQQPTTSSGWDAAKESRYQEWKKNQSK